mmetsp:Transcript_22151/g.63175  ORF Transcript_22151/g.63175 Transcript_22151/m.63175 type:complete len:107 (-) Transcript_22151:204-524(-)
MVVCRQQEMGRGEREREREESFYNPTRFSARLSACLSVSLPLRAYRAMNIIKAMYVCLVSVFPLAPRCVSLPCRPLNPYRGLKPMCVCAYAYHLSFLFGCLNLIYL